MRRQICYTGKKPHPDYSARKVLPGRLRKLSCQAQWDFSHQHKIHIYLQVSAWAWQMGPGVKIKINGLNSPWMLEAQLAKWVRQSHKVERMMEAVFFQGDFPVWNWRWEVSLPAPSLDLKHIQAYTTSGRCSVLWLRPHTWNFPVSVTSPISCEGGFIVEQVHAWLNTATNTSWALQAYKRTGKLLPCLSDSPSPDQKQTHKWRIHRHGQLFPYVTGIYFK